ncbi:MULTISPECIES: cation:proton antiporter [Streptomyces]|uniref:cation:proton antiporter n=1 Tax=Streptomyces TaxID=1883 RepID=UPI0004D8F39A|nr:MULTISPECIES: cation:proton antiporter [Streptomyces]
MLLAFAVVLLLAVLVSSLAHRTILSTAALFLIAGFLLGKETTGVLQLTADSALVEHFAELALFAVLFTDGMRVGWTDLRSAWRLPGRALGWGLPLTLGLTALLAHYIVGLDWPEALLLGAILAPTDPVFAAALVGNKRVPGRLRHLLNVESGINDGLALPFVILFLGISEGSGDLHLDELATELALGVLLGVAVPWLAIKLEQTRFFAASAAYEPLNAFAIGLVVLGLGQVLHANLFLAAFAAGVTVATFGPRQRKAFDEFGELVAELLKLAALLVFGALISVEFLGEISWSGWVFAVLALVLVRPVALAIAFARSHLSRREQAAAMWFGPKGFASVVYALLVLKSGIAEADLVFHLVALTIVLSILAHSSTDIVVARSFDEPEETPNWQDHEESRETEERPEGWEAERTEKPPTGTGTGGGDDRAAGGGTAES